MKQGISFQSYVSPVSFLEPLAICPDSMIRESLDWPFSAVIAKKATVPIYRESGSVISVVGVNQSPITLRPTWATTELKIW